MIPRSRGRRAFTTVTLIEVLVIVGIILVMAAHLLPAVATGAGEAARRAVCINNMMQIGIALQNYETIYGAPSGVVNDTGPIKNVAAGYHFSWMTQILPLMDRRAIHQKLDYSVSVYDSANITCRETLIAAFLCPSDSGPGRESDFIASNNYAACHHDSEAPIDVTNNGTFFEQRDSLRRHHGRNVADDFRGREEAHRRRVRVGFGNSLNASQQRDIRGRGGENGRGCRSKCVGVRKPQSGRRFLLAS